MLYCLPAIHVFINHSPTASASSSGTFVEFSIFQNISEVNMNQVILVGLGGAIGSIARFKLSGLLLAYTLNWRFPLPTFVVNIAGCLIIGVLAGLATKEQFFTADLRVLFFTGLVSGFTTFSAFGLETFMLIRRGELSIALAYVVFSIVIGLMLIWLGFMLALPKN
jgi:fluoride exporter